MQQEIESFRPVSRQQWREWLREHHDKKQAIWLVYPRKNATLLGITYHEAVEEALCFGWIDSKAQPIDDHSYRQFFSRRKPGSGWSKINKERVQRLMDAGLLAEAGNISIDRAKKDGSWGILDDIEALIIPADLAEALQQRPDAYRHFLKLSRSDKRALLLWILSAKRSLTRQNRIAELIDSTERQQKPVWLQRLKISHQR